MWSRKYEKCLNCGTTKIPYRANGYCRKCFFKYFINGNPERREQWKKQVKSWRIKNKKRSDFLIMRATAKRFFKKYPEEANKIYVGKIL